MDTQDRQNSSKTAALPTNNVLTNYYKGLYEYHVNKSWEAQKKTYDLRMANIWLEMKFIMSLVLNVYAGVVLIGIVMFDVKTQDFELVRSTVAGLVVVMVAAGLVLIGSWLFRIIKQKIVKRRIKQETAGSPINSAFGPPTS